MVLYVHIFPSNTPDFIQIMWVYVLFNTEWLDKVTYTIQSEDNLTKCLKEINKLTLSLINYNNVRSIF